MHIPCQASTTSWSLTRRPLGRNVAGILVYVSDISREEKEAAASNLNEAWQPAACLLYSLCIEAGVSYTGMRRFYRVFGYVSQDCVSAASVWQMLRRIRSMKSHTIYELVAPKCSLSPVAAEVPLQDVEDVMAGPHWCDARSI